MPIVIFYIPMSGTLNPKGEVEAVKIKATNKDN